MKYLELYVNNRESVVEHIKNKWSANQQVQGDNETQDIRSKQAISAKVAEIIASRLFTSMESQPVVQGMECYESVTGEEKQLSLDLIGEDFWKQASDQTALDKNAAEFNYPYKHQYECWKSLLTDKKSIVVTTGTGSGKTECFMLPIVKDIAEYKAINNGKRGIKAIIMYPLNALMEDQKDRLFNLIKDKNLTFAVYNGDLEEDYIENPRNARERAANEKIKRERNKYSVDGRPVILATRKEMREEKPDILLTNPTMIEYMLIRQNDQVLFPGYDEENKSPLSGMLRWIAIDETHTYKGASATELAMQLRRVQDAFHTQVSEEPVRFATSSATMSNGRENPDLSEEQKEAIRRENESSLKNYISTICSIEPERLNVIGGKQVETHHEDRTINEVAARLSAEQYVKLSDLLGDNTIEDNLRTLDNYCERGLKTKVHFFYRVANNGLRVRLDQISNGTYETIYTGTPSATSNSPYLELGRCKCCGNYIALGEKKTNTTIKAVSRKNNDIFTERQQTQFKFFGLHYFTDAEQVKDGNRAVAINNDTILPKSYSNEWGILLNETGLCPFCAKALIKEETSSLNYKNIEVFKLYPNDVSQWLAPSILEQINPVIPNSTDEQGHEYRNVAIEGETVANEHLMLHHGQQYLSFVDNRQAAASATLDQNIEEERRWVIGSIFKRLNKGISTEELENKVEELHQSYPIFPIDQIRQMVEGGNYSQLSWKDIVELLMKDPTSNEFALQFMNKKDEGEYCQTGIKQEAKRKYIVSVLYENLARIHKLGMGPDNTGLFQSHYEKLNKIIALPESVTNINTRLRQQISLEDWKELLKMYLDHQVRSNESLYLRVLNSHGEDVRDYENLDIHSTGRFGTEKSRRRAQIPPKVNNGSQSIVTLLIARLFFDAGENPTKQQLSETISAHRAEIQKVLNDLWKNLTEDTHLLQPSWHIEHSRNGQPEGWVLDTPDTENENDSNDEDVDLDEEEVAESQDSVVNDEVYAQNYQNAKERPYRLNIADISFKLVDKPLVANISSKSSMEPRYSFITSSFKGYSPYKVDGIPASCVASQNPWEKYDYSVSVSSANYKQQIEDYARQHRSLLVDYKIWGPEGRFSIFLNDIYCDRPIFIQAEHTAQVNKPTQKDNQERFKQQLINILACSTTMEMGVDLGKLELVMMSSIPPMPANYKQRAGRSGRGGQNKSACITLCTSDSVGARTYRDPIGELIKREVEPPYARLTNENIILRHINAFIFREFLTRELRVNATTLTVGSFFTNYVKSRNTENVRGDDETTYSVDHYVINGTNPIEDATPSMPVNISETVCGRFMNYYYSLDISENRLDFLLKNTVYMNHTLWDRARNNSMQILEECRDHFLLELEAIGNRYRLEQKQIPAEANYRIKEDDESHLRTRIYKYLYHNFVGLLDQQLIMYFADTRFTPNANMPFEVICFDETPYLLYDNKDNPSYTLHRALSQYAPGRKVVVDNHVRIVRGLTTTDLYNTNDQFHKLYKTGSKVELSTSVKDNLAGYDRWGFVSNTLDLTLVEAKNFIPDINESANRNTDPSEYYKVHAQLIDAKEWNNLYTNDLVSVRSSNEVGISSLLFYNAGIGHGFCYCPRCGKAAVESAAYGDLHSKVDLPDDFILPNLHDSHYNIRAKKKSCGNGSLLRNVIIGGTVQTDYSEIRIKEQVDGDWIGLVNRDRKPLLTTLAVLICNHFAKRMSIDRDEIDFLLTPDGHICVFDTNSGGSGYSCELGNNPQIFNEVINDISIWLQNPNSTIDEVINTSTLQYVDDLKLDVAKSWIEREINARNTVPEEVQSIFEDFEVRNSNFNTLITDILHSSDEMPVRLYTNDKWNIWNFDDVPEKGWKGRIIQIIEQAIAKNRMNISININRVENQPIPVPIAYLMIRMRGIFKDDFHYCTNPMEEENVYPIAQVGNKLYFVFTDGCLQSLNDQWGKGHLFCVELDSQYGTQEDIVLENIIANTHDFKLTYSDGDNTYYVYDGYHRTDIIRRSKELIYSKDLFGKIENDSLVQEFIQYVNNHPGNTLNIAYMDEHIKNRYAIITIIQYIQTIIEKCNASNSFSLNIKMQEYDSRTKDEKEYSCFSIQKFGSQIKTSLERDNILENVLYNWKEFSGNNSVKFESISKRVEELPHWRELVLSYGNKVLIIMPHGGIFNEWEVPYLKNYKNLIKFGFATEANVGRNGKDWIRKFEELDDPFVNLPIFRDNDIKYTIKLNTVS